MRGKEREEEKENERKYLHKEEMPKKRTNINWVTAANILKSG